jgi:acyl-coenzyme A synthetase/AMP-(fatty) acid ligase
LVLSSGTTGAPKGVLLSRAALFHSKQLLIDVFKIRPGEVYGNLSGIHTIGGLRAICLALQDRVNVRFFDGEQSEGMAYAEKVLSSGVSVALCGSSFVRLLARSAKWLSHRPTKMRALMSCGSLYDDDASEEVRRKYGIEVVNAYGQTETSGIVMCEQLGVYNKNRMAPCLPGVRQAFRPATDGLWELGIHTPWPYCGYIGQGPADVDPIWTGDLVRRLDDGISYAGRLGHAMKTQDGSGWLLPERIEAWVRQALPGSEVVARPDKKHELMLVMIDAEFIPDELHKRMISELGAAYKASRLLRARVKRTPSGKISQMTPCEE